MARSYRGVDRDEGMGAASGPDQRPPVVGAEKLDRVGPLAFSRLDGAALGYDATRDAVREIYARAAVDILPKPWHSFGTGLANAGVPVHVIKVLMGHKSIETTLRYMHTDRGARRDAIAALRGSHVAAKTENAS
jgi:integrase